MRWGGRGRLIGGRACGRFWVNSGYAPVNGLLMYYEVHGRGETGRPLVLLHGGLQTIELSFGAVLGELAAGRRVGGGGGGGGPPHPPRGGPPPRPTRAPPPAGARGGGGGPPPPPPGGC